MKQVFIGVLMLAVMSCSPAKMVTSSNNDYKVNSVSSDSIREVLDEKMKLVFDRLTEFNQILQEQSSQNVNYTEINYDSLGRKIREVTQVSEQHINKNIDTKQTEDVFVGLTVQQVDSIIRLSIETLKADIEESNSQMVKKNNGAVWWLVGVSSVLAVMLLFCVLIIYIKSRKPW